MLKVSELYIYPIKSLGGVRVTAARVTDRGFEHDRRWMLVDANNRFLSQRENAAMALLKVNMPPLGLKVIDKRNKKNITIPFEPAVDVLTDVVIWDDVCKGQLVSEDADNWFSEALDMHCRLIYMPDSSERNTEPEYAPPDSLTSFADAYPFLIIGQISLDDLNNRLARPVTVDRFRPNIVFTGGTPYAEDLMDSIEINNIKFNGVKLCARCNIPRIDQSNASIGKEPIKTMATYRFKNNKIYLGQNLIGKGTGYISVGDELRVLTMHTTARFIIG